MEKILDLISYISDKHREDIIKNKLGEENFKNLKDILNNAFVEFSKSEIISGLNIISENITCPNPKCKHSLEGAITFDSFFIL